MKIELNLARPPRRLDSSAIIWAPALIVIAALVLARILLSSWTAFGQFRQVHKSVLRYQAETAELQTKEAQAWQALHRPPVLRLYRQIGFLNSLIDEKKVSLSALASRVTRLLPTQTRLSSLAVGQAEAGGPLVQFSVEGEQEGVYAFLSNLEQSPDFGAPAVKSEAIEQQGPDKGLVVLTCSAQYLGVEPGDSEGKLR